MKRTKEWWGRLTPEERKELVVFQEAARRHPKTDAFEYRLCAGCGVLVDRGALCEKCTERFKSLIDKGNGIPTVVVAVDDAPVPHLKDCATILDFEFEIFGNDYLKPIRFMFMRYNAFMLATISYKRKADFVPMAAGLSMCHEGDVFDWEVGMKMALKSALAKFSPRRRSVIYSAFRRWIWLSKLAQKYRGVATPKGIYKICGYANPDERLAAEYGEVKVSETRRPSV